MTPVGLGMARDKLASMEDPDLTTADCHLDSLANEPPGNRVGVGVDLNSAVGVNLGEQFSDLTKWRPTI